MSNDLATESYWESAWQASDLPRLLHPVKNPVDGRTMRLFHRCLPRGGRSLEIGCAGSAWMSFFAQDLGCEIWGVDYSTTGLELARKNLELQNLQAHLVYGDFVKEPLITNSFRIIFSAGVVEHYQDPTPIFKKAYEVLEPGGVIVTIVPNMAGIFGKLQNWVDSKIYDIHVPFRPEELERAQSSVGFRPLLATRPFGVFNLGMVNWSNAFRRCPSLLRRPFGYVLQWSDRLVGWSTLWADKLLDSKATSPYLISIFQKST
jgi:SAM-dependent methyltransferase